MKIVRTFFACILVLCTLFTLFYGQFRISVEHSFGNEESYKGILKLWHVDSFEGGVGSRKQYLLKVARTFEKKYSGVLVMVVEHTLESANENLKNGIYPDMISYGNGLEINNMSELNMDGAFKGGNIGEKNYAEAWCRGGYVLIANPKLVQSIEINEIDSLLVSQSEYTQPLFSLIEEGITVQDITIKTPMNAYVQFVEGKTKYFLGTQRDVNRLERRGMEVITYPMMGYNDLYQYISITTTDNEKRFYSEEFIKVLLSEKSQSKLNEIGMLSQRYSVKYENEHLVNMQSQNNSKTISVFTSPLVLKDMQEKSKLAIKGDVEEQRKIKNMLI